MPGDSIFVITECSIILEKPEGEKTNSIKEQGTLIIIIIIITGKQYSKTYIWKLDNSQQVAKYSVTYY